MAGLFPELIDVVAEHVAANHFPGDASTIVSAAAILDDVIDTIRPNGLDDSLLSAGRAAVQRAIEAGHGAPDSPASPCSDPHHHMRVSDNW